MKLESFQIKIGEEEARALSLKRVGIIGRAVVGKAEIHMRTIFIENKIITYRVTNEPFFLTRWFRPDAKRPQSLIRMIANGSTCGVSYYDGIGVELVDLEVEDDQVQLSDYPDDKFITRGNALARRILRRRVGGNVQIEPIEVKSVFRPYHVAFFGEPAQGARVRYLPIAADACSVKRTF